MNPVIQNNEVPSYPAMVLVAIPDGSDPLTSISRVSILNNETLGKGAKLAFNYWPLESDKPHGKKGYFSKELVEAIDTEKLGQLIKDAALKLEEKNRLNQNETI
ncbi:hypothetical protein HIU98_15580 [Enterococcus casseliflavus]|nr:hypothetical protein [Enterococcus casseliflavus]